MNFMPPDKFVKLCERWAEAKGEIQGNPDHDQGVMEGLIALNRMAGLVSIWSCEGHPKGKTPGMGYIMVGVKDQDALARLFKIYENLTRGYTDYPNMVRLTATTRGDATVKFGVTEVKTWHPVWILNWPVFEGQKALCFRQVNKAIVDELQ